MLGRVIARIIIDIEIVKMIKIVGRKVTRRRREEGIQALERVKKMEGKGLRSRN